MINKNVDSRNRIKLRNWVSISGIFVSVIALVLIFLKIEIPKFGLIYQSGENEFFISLSVVLWIILLYLGLYMISKFLMNTSIIRENIVTFREHEFKNARYNFSSFSLSRLGSAVFLIISAIIQYLQFGPNFLNEEGLGCWLFLGGPSLFYPTAVLMLPFALGLLLYFILSMAKIRINTTKEICIISERRFFTNTITDIPKQSIEKIILTNAKSGPKYFWIIPFGLHFWLLSEDALSFLTNPMIYGQGTIMGIFYMVQVVTDCLVLGILLFFHQTYLEIQTSEKKYEIQFSPFRQRKHILSLFDEIFKFSASNSLDVVKNSGKINLCSSIKHYRKLISGILLILIAILSRVFQFYASLPLRLLLLFYGIILILKCIKADIPKSKCRTIQTDNDRESGQYSYYIGDYYYYLRYSSTEYSDKTPHHLLNRKKIPSTMEVWDLLFIFGIMLMAILQLISVIYLIPSDIENYLLYILLQMVPSLLIGVLLSWSHKSK